MQIVNDVAKRGFVIGWDPLKLGNALSTVATLFVLSRRTGLPTLFPYADRYSEIFASGRKLSRIHVPRGIDEERLEALLADLHGTLESLPNMAGIKGTGFDDLGDARVKGVIWFSRHEAYLSDWRDGGAERRLKAFCRRGNGVVLQGAYWRQYRDMRELRRDGEALRAHLGPLREIAPSGPPIPPGAVKIGIHLRLGDYKVWLDGRFFFPIEAYRAIADRLHAEMGDRPHVFRIFSDQPIPTDAFAGLPVETSSDDSFEHFVLLSQCAVVVGPPNTFATWAAFFGRGERIVLDTSAWTLNGPLLRSAVPIPFPTGAYLHGDSTAAPI